MRVKMSQKKTLIVLTVLIVGIYFGFIGFACAGITKAYGAEDQKSPRENVEMNKELGSGKDTSTNEEIKGKEKEENKGAIEGTSEANKQGEVKKNAEGEKRILKVEYKEGLLSVDLQNVEIIDVLKTIGEKATIEIDIGPGIEGKIEKMQFEKLSIRDAMTKLIEASGRGIVVEYSDDKAKRIRVGKKLGDKVLKKDKPTKKVTTLPDGWPADIIKKIDLRYEKDLYIKYTKKSKIEEEKYSSRFLFFDKDGNLTKEIIYKPWIEKIIKRDKKDFLQITAMNYDLARNGKHLAIEESLNEQEGEYNPNIIVYEPYHRRIKSKLTYYDNEGNVLFEKDNYFFAGNTLKIDKDGSFILIAENSTDPFLSNPIKEFDERIYIFDKNGNELCKYDCKSSILHFYKRNGNTYLVGQIGRQKRDVNAPFKNFWRGVFFFDGMRNKYWIKFTETPDTIISIKAIDDKGNILDDKGNILIEEKKNNKITKRYQLSRDGELLKQEK